MVPPYSLNDFLAPRGWVRRLAHGLATDDADAQDAVQEAALSIWRRPPPPENPRGWIVRVVQNHLRGGRRSAGRRAARDLAVALDSETKQLSAEQLLILIERERDVARHVLALEAPFREVIILRYYDGLQSTQIGQRLGVPAGTVRWRLKAALDQLRDVLDERKGSVRKHRGVMFMVGLSLIAPTVFLVVSRLRSADTRPVVAAFRNDASALRFANDDSLAARPANCESALTAAQGLFTATMSRAQQYLPPRVAFAHGDPNPNAAKTIEPIVARILWHGAFDRTPTLACRGLACRLDVVTPMQDDGAFVPDLAAACLLTKVREHAGQTDIPTHVSRGSRSYTIGQ